MIIGRCVTAQKATKSWGKGKETSIHGCLDGIGYKV